MFGHIQGDGHVTESGDSIVLGTACEAHGNEMALALRPCECERQLADPAASALFSWGRKLDDAQDLEDPEARNPSGNRQKFLGIFLLGTIRVRRQKRLKPIEP